MITSNGLSSEERRNVPSSTSLEETNQSDPWIAQQQSHGDGEGIGSKMQGVLDSCGVIDQDLLIAREMIKEKITQYVLTHQPTSILQRRIPSISNIVGSIDDFLFNRAASKEVYMNLDTLEARLQALVKSRAYQSKTHCVSSSTPVNMTIPTPGSNTVIPTPRMPHGGTCSVNLVDASSNSGMLMMIPAGSGRNLEALNRDSSIGYNGAFIGSDVPSTVLSDISGKMIPNPGLKNTKAMLKSLSSGEGAHFGIESTLLSQQQYQNQIVRNQSSRIKQNLGVQLGIRLGSNMRKTYGSSNGVAYFGNEKQLMNGSLVSDGFLDASASSNFSELMKQEFRQKHHQSLQPRNSYGVNNITGTENWYLGHPAVSTVSDLHYLNRSEAIAAPPNYKRYLHMTHQSLEKPLYVDCLQEMEFQSTKNLLQIPQQMHDSQLFAQFIQHKHPFIATGPIRQPMHVQGGAESIEKSFPQAQGVPDLLELPGYQQNNMVDEKYMGISVIGRFSASQNLQPSTSQDSQHIPQEFDPNQRTVGSWNTLGSLSNERRSEVLQGQWSLEASEGPHVPGQKLLHHIQNDYKKQPVTQADGQQSHFSLDEPCSSYSVADVVSTEGEKTSVVSSTKSDRLCSTKHRNQQRWLLFLYHTRRCPIPRGKCRERFCVIGQDLWRHMGKCSAEDCVQSLCRRSKGLIKHYRDCHTANCPVCIPVRDFIASNGKPPSDASNFFEANGSWKTSDNAYADKHVPKSSSSSIQNSEEPPSSKRLKVGHPSSKGEIYSISSQQAQIQACQQVDPGISVNREVTNTKLEPYMNSERGKPSNLKTCKINDGENKILAPAGCQPKLEKTRIDRYFNKPKIEIKEEATHSLNPSGTKSGKPKIQGVSLTELFTPEQVKEHINGLRQWVGQTKAKVKKNQAMNLSMSANSCQLCAVEKLAFEPPPMYCSRCGVRIKNNAIYYTCGNSDTRLYLCSPCHRGARGDTVKVDGLLILKKNFQKKKNDEKAEEWWVQCDKCEAWQHQICALFNGRRNDKEQAEYTCPNCYALEVERGERTPLTPNAILGADDLPKTLLSDHLEQRLLRKLKQERQDRARFHGKSFDEVPGAESLVVRVVSSVDKKLVVKPRFLEIFHEDKYPKVFPYKSKVVLLFQKIEGVEVCLFGMYVQEFGSECEFPNQRRLYLSYLDSVKYFRPEVQTVNGEALRTFVYHEILIGYLEYCKKRGFTSCYIWACPPLKGEDYILYCHPEIQKTPKSDKLREWYLQMLRKAKKENIVVDLTNLYDHFFVTTGECKAKVTAARLPYFDGDYWPGAAEDIINMLQQEEDGRKQNKKGETKETITRRTLKAAGQTNLYGNASKDALLMQKLGEIISPMKEDFIMVHLQHACNHCCFLMVSGNRWLCSQCRNFQLCERCYITEQKCEEKDRHPNTSMDKHKHQLYQVQITDVPSDTKDSDGIIESEYFDTRQAFLSLCQGNHYQYDTLRRAKYSSMMLLYHLHNPTASAFVATCNVCLRDIETGQGWHCDVCADFDMCNSCYTKDGGLDHPHKLTNQQSVFDAQNTEARQKRVLQLRRMLDLLVHASKCRGSESLHCKYPDCQKVKGVFRHAKLCEVRALGGCQVCRRIWNLLRLHAHNCKESVCCVPRCRDLKEHFGRLQKQSDSRRRAAVKEMIRQRAAEAVGNS